MVLAHLLLVLEGLQYETNIWETISYESFDVVRFGLGPCLEVYSYK